MCVCVCGGGVVHDCTMQIHYRETHIMCSIIADTQMHFPANVLCTCTSILSASSCLLNKALLHLSTLGQAENGRTTGGKGQG